MYPSEYAYLNGSVRTFENDSANCRNYPRGNLQSCDHPEDFIHCNGAQLKLTDSIFGQEEHQTRDYYAWRANRDGQLLFVFPTTVSLTTITLHYHNDNFRSLPRLRFYAVPDDFNVWNNPNTTCSYPRVDVASFPSGGELAVLKNVSINVNFTTTKVLMYKYSSSSSFMVFAVSEVEFFICENTSKYL